MRNLAITGVECVTAACATLGKQPKPKRPAAPTWRCYEVDAGDKRVMTLVKTSVDSGKVHMSDKVWPAAYSVRGIYRRWEFGGVYLIILNANWGVDTATSWAG